MERYQNDISILNCDREFIVNIYNTNTLVNPIRLWFEMNQTKVFWKTGKIVLVKSSRNNFMQCRLSFNFSEYFEELVY